MATEIERKFIVSDLDVLAGRRGTAVVQGYLSVDPDRTVRVRRAGSRAWLTVKGRANGAVRPEFEYEIPAADAAALMSLCSSTVSKTRYRVDHAAHTWEIDVFDGPLAGLVTAEVELRSPRERVELPAWIGREVTDDPRFTNAALSVDPSAALRAS